MSPPTRKHKLRKLNEYSNYPIGHWNDNKIFVWHFQLLYQRMASDTDLWLGLKARQAKYKNVFGGKKELSPVEDERSYVTLEGDREDKPTTKLDFWPVRD